MKETFSDLPGWIFDLDEVSANVYEVIGRDTYGHCVFAKGVDLDDLLEKCRKQAKCYSSNKE